MNALEQGYTVKDGTIIHPKRPFAACKPETEGRHFCISIAGHKIGIDSIFGEVYSICKDYLSEDNPDIMISISKDDIEAEKDRNKNCTTFAKDSYLETMAVYRKICEALLTYDIFLMHGAVVAYQEYAYMFTAESGTGKTTHIKKWLKNLNDAYVVNGDKPLIRMTETKAVACGTPWCGKEQMGTNTMVPLKAIVIMERGEDNTIEEISLGKAFPFLLYQTYQPNGADEIKKTLRLIARLNGKVRFYRFVFNNLKEDSFDVAYHALAGEKP